MKQDIINTIILAGAFLSLFAIAELLYHYAKVKAELTRKLVHFGTGILSLLFPIMLSNHWFVLALCASFALILIASLKFNLLKSINAIDRKSYGSLCYPLAVYSCFLIQSWYGQQSNYYGGYLIYYLPLLILAISDPVAALVGKRWAWIPYNVGKGTKTMAGTLAFFGSAFLISLVAFFAFQITLSMEYLVVSCLLIGVVTAMSEAVSRNGFDNLFIPLSGSLVVYGCLILFGMS